MIAPRRRLRADSKIGIGTAPAVNFVPCALEFSYGGDPRGTMVFLRLIAE